MAASPSTPLRDLLTVRDLLRWAISRFNAAKLVYGHGTTTALDEAAFLILESLHLPIDQLEPFLEARLLALPDRLAPQLFDQPTVGDTRNLIRAAIREVLDDLAQPNIELETDIDLEGVAGPEADGGEGTGGTEATAGPDDQRLGGSEPTSEL